MQVSVVIPVYQAERFLERAVNSALACPEVAEVVLVEDGSPDGSLAVCEQLVKADERVKLFRHRGGVNKGAGATRNLGIEKATWDMIAFLDADDFYLPHRFETDGKVLAEHPDADGVYNAIGISYDEDTPELRAAFREREFATMPPGVAPEDLFDEIMPVGRSGHFSLDGLTVRKSALIRTHGFNVKLRLMQDTELILQLALVARLLGGLLDAPVAIRGVHGANRSTNQSEIKRRFSVLMYESLLSRQTGLLSRARRDHLLDLYFKELNRSAPGEAGMGRRVYKLKKLAALVARQPALFFPALRYSFGAGPH